MLSDGPNDRNTGSQVLSELLIDFFQIILNQFESLVKRRGPLFWHDRLGG
jgi:hypothetical protein